MEAKDKLQKLISESVDQLIGEKVPVQLEHPAQEAYGDYSTNVAMVAFAKSKIKSQKSKLNSPMELAEEIRQKLLSYEAIEQLCEKIEVAPPGFINLFLSQKALLSELLRVLKEVERYGQSKISNQKIAVEHTSPNTNKPLHVGHIRNNVLSMAVIRLLKAMGNAVEPVEIINDRGAHIMQSMYGYLCFGQKGQKSVSDSWDKLLDLWVSNTERWITPQEVEADYKKPDKFVGHYYVKAEQFKQEKTDYVTDQLQEMLIAWEAGDERVRKLWQTMNAWFYQGAKETYERIGSLESRRWFESEIYQQGKEIVEQNMGEVFVKQEDGSVIADLTKYKLPNPIVLRADGTSIYMTQDIALLKDRKEKLNADKLVYVVANEQALHFKQLFAIAQELGYGSKDDFYHLSYGMVRLTTGPMSSRLGTVINADDLMDQAVKKAREVIDRAKISKNIDDVDKLAEQIGIGAIKYTMLSYHPQGDIIFDPDKSISFEGNSGPYLQYTFARTQSVLANATTDYRLPTTAVDSSLWTVDLQAEELAILRYLYRFPEVIQDAALNYSPNILCTFLFDLAQKFNTFYAKHRILQTDEDGNRNGMLKRATFRLSLTQATGIILKSGLNLLGISAPDKM